MLSAKTELLGNAVSTGVMATRVIAIALAYFITGRLGLELAIVGSNITLIWLPTGIAVAALFRWGWQYWPAVWLGALLGMLASATGGVATLVLGGLLPQSVAGTAWIVWWLGDSVGVIVAGMAFITFDRQECVVIRIADNL